MAQQGIQVLQLVDWWEGNPSRSPYFHPPCLCQGTLHGLSSASHHLRDVTHGSIIVAVHPSTFKKGLMFSLDSMRFGT